MRKRPTRPVVPVLFRIVLCAGAALLAAARPAPAALLALRPGPIERPRHVAAGDFNRDGFDDLVIANFQAGTLHLLISRRDGTFAPHSGSPILVGFATFSQPTSGPLQILVADLNPEDADGDRALNADDNCPNLPNSGQEDAETAAGPDGDCGTLADNNPPLYGPDTLCGTADDLTGNGTGDACQTLGPGGGTLDPDQDGVPTYDPAKGALDNCPAMPNPKVCSGAPATPCASDADCPGAASCLQPDADSDGVGDACAASPDLVILENSLGAGDPRGIVRVRVNDGSGGMLSRPSKATGVSPSQALLADFDGDGRPDLLYANRANDDMQVLSGLADGEFAPSRRIPTGDGPQGLAAGDFDGDGDADLAVANSCDHTLAVYVNPGTGLPDTVTHSIPTSAQPTAILSGLLDDDALADLTLMSRDDSVCSGGPRAGKCCADDRDCADAQDAANNGTCGPAGSGSGMIEVYLGSASGPPALNGPATLLLAPGQNPAAGLLLDLNGDGELDLAVADFGTLSLAAPAINAGKVLLHAGAGDGTFATPVTPAELTGLPQPVALAPLHLDPATPGGPDLAVLMFGANRVDLFLNPDDGGLSFMPAPTSPASPWKGTSSMQLFGADPPVVGIDVVLLQEAPPRLDILSGIGTGVFVALPAIDIDGPARATGMVVTDLKDDSVSDLVLFGEGKVCDGGPRDGGLCAADGDCADPSDPPINGTCSRDTGTLTVLTNEFFGSFAERATITVGAAVTSAASGSLITTPDDFDRDGILNVLDNCPTRFNPASCAVTDAACRLEIPCADMAVNPTDCAALDPATGQCDSDGNGIGDHCQILTGTCAPLDDDLDLRFDYNPNALVRAPGGPDFDRDGVANVDDNCPTTANLDQNDLINPNGIGDACEAGTDVNGNGIIEAGRFCSVTTLTSCTVDAGCPAAETCSLTETVDTDLDGVLDYDPNALVRAPGGLDFDRDGVANVDDNCPTTANNLQTDSNINGVGNACEAGTDVNGNGVIEAGLFFCVTTLTSCTVDADCPAMETCSLTETADADFDGVLDYDPGPPAALDNCPTVFNPAQKDKDGDGVGNACVIREALDNCPALLNPGQEDNDGDGVGNACLVRAALDNCPLRGNPTQADADGDGVGDICEVAPVQDVVAVSPAAGAVSLFTGDGTGALHEPSFSPLDGLVNPSAAAVGTLSLNCVLGMFLCSRKPTNDLVVAETVDPGDASDDRLVVYLNGDAGFRGTCDAGFCTAPLEASGACLGGICVGGPNAGAACSFATLAPDCGRACAGDRDCARLPPAPATGNPSALLRAADQRVCSSASTPSVSDVRFAQNNRTDVIAAVQPDTASLGIYLPSNQALIDASQSSLVPPPGNPAPLPVPAPVVDAAMADINQDGIQDLVAVSSGDGDPATPNVTIYLGIGNGLFFTDPTLNPTDVPDGAARMAVGNVNLATDSFFPEVALFSAGDEAPAVLTNILLERADIDGSRRVDGFDLAVLARAFGARRGEDFVLEMNPTGLVVLKQTSDSPPYRRLLVPADGEVIGQNLPDSDGVCNSTTDSMEDPDGVCDTVTSTCSAGASGNGVCDTGSGLCTDGDVGATCTTDVDCDTCALNSDCNTGVVRYGLAADINLDGIVDGRDLAIVASRFGRRL